VPGDGEAFRGHGGLVGVRRAGSRPSSGWPTAPRRLSWPISGGNIYSHEVGLLKPDPDIFKLTCDRLGTAPADCLLVDDHPANVTAARAAGWHAILFEDNPRTIAGIQMFLQ